MLDRVFATVLLLNLTGLFSFVAINVGLPIAAMSAGILAFLLFYVGVNYRCAYWFFQKKVVFLWIVLIFLWPAVTTVYSINPNLRMNAINLYLVTLAIATAVWLSRAGMQRARWVFVGAFVITITGLLLSLVQNEYFQSVADAADARYSYYGRAFGFFLQPNMAAINLTFLYVLVLPYLANSRASIAYLVSAVFFTSVLLTGSRGGIVVGLAAVLYVHLSSLETRRLFTLRRVGLAIVVAAVIGMAVLVANRVSDSTSAANAPTSQFALADRLDALQSLDLDSPTSGSISARILVIAQHAEGIADRPILGHGIGASSHMAATGRFAYTAHNQYVQVAYDFGIPALGLFAFLLYKLWNMATGSEFRDAYGINPILAILIAAGLASIISHSILTSRVFFAALGALIAMHYARNELVGAAGSATELSFPDFEDSEN